MKSNLPLLFLPAIVFAVTSKAVAATDPFAPMDPGGLLAPDAPHGQIDPKFSALTDIPFTRYHHRLMQIIGERWTHSLQGNPVSNSSGTAMISIRISKSGTLIDTKIIPGFRDDLAKFSIDIIKHCTLPPMPDDVVPKMKNGALEVKLNFVVY